MSGPLLKYIVDGYYFADNFDHIHERPCNRVCNIFKKDCSNVFKIYEGKMRIEKLGKLICIKILTNIFQQISDEDINLLQDEKKMDYDMNDFLQLFKEEWRMHSGKEEESLYLYMKQVVYKNKEFLTSNQIFDKIFSDLTKKRLKVKDDIIYIVK